ncbi:unnamed protein product [Sphagnum jensenii]|uniref:Uncharacterized protein n=1 Tax=Sphagnum jensenii TaxID=128206 RepID=A0ABP1BEP4_9BRYO
MTEGLMERVDILIARSLSNLTESLKSRGELDRVQEIKAQGSKASAATNRELDCSRNTGHAKKIRNKKSQPSPRVLGTSAGLNVSRASAHPSSDESSRSDRRLESVKAEKNSTDCKNSNVEDRKAVPQPTGFVSDLQKELNCSRNTGHAKKNRKKKSQPSPKVVGASAGLNASHASAHPSNDASSISDRKLTHLL